MLVGARVEVSGDLKQSYTLPQKHVRKALGTEPAFSTLVIPGRVLT